MCWQRWQRFWAETPFVFTILAVPLSVAHFLHLQTNSINARKFVITAYRFGNLYWLRNITEAPFVLASRTLFHTIANAVCWDTSSIVAVEVGQGTVFWAPQGRIDGTKRSFVFTSVAVRPRTFVAQKLERIKNCSNFWYTCGRKPVQLGCK